MPSATPAAEASQRSAKGLAKMRPPGPPANLSSTRIKSYRERRNARSAALMIRTSHRLRIIWIRNPVRRKTTAELIRASQQDHKIKGSNPVELIYLSKVVPTLFKSTSASVTSCTRTNYEFNKLNH